jgi:hypothetical protein
MSESFERWLEREMPAGTVIGDPKWWANKLRKAVREEMTKGQEPVAWVNMTGLENPENDTFIVRRHNIPPHMVPLYLHPTPPPEGMVMVPKEPTEAMKKSAAGLLYASEIYRAMLTAYEADK